jgi:uncharacterized protein YlxW (UPF0749 family)
VRRSTMIWVLVVSLGVVALAVWFLTSRDNSKTAGISATESTVATPASNNDAHEVAKALSRLVTDPDSLVASSSRSRVAGRAREAVPSGSTVEVDERSWSPDGVGGDVITVTLTSPGGQPERYAVVMAQEDDQWKVVATAPILDDDQSGVPTR